MTYLLILFWACVALYWIFILLIGSLAVMGIMKAYDFVRGLWIARRNERQVQTDMLMRAGFRRLASGGYVREDLQ